MKKIILFSILIFGILTITAYPAYAAGLVPCGGEGESACQFCHIFILFNTIVNFVFFKLVPPLAVLMLVIGGFMYIFAYMGPATVLQGGGKGGPALLSQAKKLITSVIWGLVIVYSAYLAINIVFSFLGLSDFAIQFTGPDKWATIECIIQ